MRGVGKDETVGFWDWAARAPERAAVIEVDGGEVSFGALFERVNRLGSALSGQGVGAGDAVAAVMRNRSDFIELILAAMNGGWYIVPINHHATTDDIAYILDNADARVAVVDEEFAGAVRPALDAAGIGEAGRIVVGAAPGYRPIEEVRAQGVAERPPSSVCGQIMQYTSGTTGRPKGVRRPIENRPADEAAREVAGYLRLFGVAPGGGAHLVTSPLYHTAVQTFTLAALHFGQTAVLMDKWTPEACLDLVQRHRITTTHMVATHFHRLLRLPEEKRANADMSSFKHVIHGAAPTPVEVKRAMIDWLGPVIYEYYGSSEVGGTMVNSEDWLARPGTVGKPFAISELKILDENENELGVREVGQIWMRQGDQGFSYHKDEGKTRRATKGKFIHVGDMGYVDEDGFLFLTGRDAEIIISGGVNIYPFEIEARLLAHPAVRDCGVIGAPNAEYGEEVKAVVELAHDIAPSAEMATSLIDHCRAGLSSISVPKSVDFLETLPRDPNGKLMKHKLRARYWPERDT